VPGEIWPLRGYRRSGGRHWENAAERDVEAVNRVARADDQAAERIEGESEQGPTREHAVADTGTIESEPVDGARAGCGVDDDGRVRGEFRATGTRPKFAGRLAKNGIELPKELFQFKMEV